MSDNSSKGKFLISLKQDIYSEHELYYKFISIHNVVKDWGLTPTQINIIIYLLRHGYSQKTKEMICKNLKITMPSLRTNLSHLRQGKVGKKRIQKLLDISSKNNNMTLLKQELIDIQSMIESDRNHIYIQFNTDAFKVTE